MRKLTAIAMSLVLSVSTLGMTGLPVSAAEVTGGFAVEEPAEASVYEEALPVEMPVVFDTDAGDADLPESAEEPEESVFEAEADVTAPAEDADVTDAETAEFSAVDPAEEITLPAEEPAEGQNDAEELFIEETPEETDLWESGKNRVLDTPTGLKFGTGNETGILYYNPVNRDVKARIILYRNGSPVFNSFTFYVDLDHQERSCDLRAFFTQTGTYYFTVQTYEGDSPEKDPRASQIAKSPNFTYSVSSSLAVPSSVNWLQSYGELVWSTVSGASSYWLMLYRDGVYYDWIPSELLQARGCYFSDGYACYAKLDPFLDNNGGGQWSVSVIAVSSDLSSKRSSETAQYATAVQYLVSGYLETATYTGSRITFPALRVCDANGKELTKKEYSVTYVNNVQPASAMDPNPPQIIIKGKGNLTGEKVVPFTIAKPDIDGSAFTCETLTVALKSGSAAVPTPVLLWGKKKLKAGTDYTVDFYNASHVPCSEITAAGGYYFILTGQGVFQGTRQVNCFAKENLVKVKMSAVSAKIENVVYTGSDTSPAPGAIAVLYKGTPLTLGKDYTVSYPDLEYITPGTKTVILKGTGTSASDTYFIGEKKLTYKVTQVPMKQVKIADISDVTFDNMEWIPDPTVTWEGSPLTKGADYDVSYRNNREAGTAVVTFTGRGRFTGSVSRKFKIRKLDLIANSWAQSNFLCVYRTNDGELADGKLAYEKGGWKLKPEIYYNGVPLDPKNYSIKYSKNWNQVGKVGQVIINYKGSFVATKKTKYGHFIHIETFYSHSDFSFVQAPIYNLSLTAKDLSFGKSAVMKGYLAAPVVTDLNGKKLKAKTDYSAIHYYYANNTELVTGMAAAGSEVKTTDVIKDTSKTVFINIGVNADAGSGTNYTGTLYGTYRILGNTSNLKNAVVTLPLESYAYTGAPICPAPLVSLGGEFLVAGQDYQVSYKNNVKKGTATVTVTGIGPRTGSKTATFKITERSIH